MHRIGRVFFFLVAKRIWWQCFGCLLQYGSPGSGWQHLNAKWRSPRYFILYIYIHIYNTQAHIIHYIHIYILYYECILLSRAHIDWSYCRLCQHLRGFNLLILSFAKRLLCFSRGNANENRAAMVKCQTARPCYLILFAVCTQYNEIRKFSVFEGLDSQFLTMMTDSFKEFKMYD